jgi:hypothetical protein
MLCQWFSTPIGAEGLNLHRRQDRGLRMHRRHLLPRCCLLTDEREWSRQRFALMAQAQAWTAARLAAGSWPELLAGLLAMERA